MRRHGAVNVCAHYNVGCCIPYAACCMMHVAQFTLRVASRVGTVTVAQAAVKSPHARIALGTVELAARQCRSRAPPEHLRMHDTAWHGACSTRRALQHGMAMAAMHAATETPAGGAHGVHALYVQHRIAADGICATYCSRVCCPRAARMGTLGGTLGYSRGTLCCPGAARMGRRRCRHGRARQGAGQPESKGIHPKASLFLPFAAVCTQSHRRSAVYPSDAAHCAAH